MSARLRRHAAAFAFAAGLVAFLAAPEAARTHTRSMSTASWEIASGPPATARVVVRVALQDLGPVVADAAGGLVPGALSPLAQLAVDDALQRRFVLRAGGRPCAALGASSAVPTADPSHLARAWRVRCDGSGPLEIRTDAFFDVSPTHLHIARVRQDGGPALEHVVVIERRTVSLAGMDASGPDETGSGLLDYVKLGVDHIVSGVDHLVFLLALLLAGRSVAQVAMIVTGFTAAHSVTLALGVLGVIRPSSSAIEALIGLSIAIVALENFVETSGRRVGRAALGGLGLLLAASFAGALAGHIAVPALTLAGVGLFTFCYARLLGRVQRPETLRWSIAFVFGLIHGFGFAGALAETALPQDRLLTALFGFNLGVEAGQIAIVLLAWPLLRLALHRSEEARAWTMQLGSAPVLAAGLFWFLSRAWA